MSLRKRTNSIPHSVISSNARHHLALVRSDTRPISKGLHRLQGIRQQFKRLLNRKCQAFLRPSKGRARRASSLKSSGNRVHRTQQVFQHFYFSLRNLGHMRYLTLNSRTTSLRNTFHTIPRLSLARAPYRNRTRLLFSN